MNDYISIDNLEVFANHGVLKEETVLGQKFVICAKLFFDADKASESDDIHDSINYAEICAFITKYLSDNTFKLIEKVASMTAKELLYRYEDLQSVEIIVKKPWAPIGLPINNIMIGITKRWSEVYLSLGSNMGDKEAYLDFAVNALKEDRNVKEVKVSSYIKTEPYGGVKQDDFLNAAVKIKTIYSPMQLLARINELEQLKDRKRDIHWGPRTLDIDILMYEDFVINEDKLIIPHPDMCNRGFVLEPLCEIAPYAVHPIKRMTIKELKESLK